MDLREQTGGSPSSFDCLGWHSTFLAQSWIRHVIAATRRLHPRDSSRTVPILWKLIMLRDDTRVLSVEVQSI